LHEILLEVESDFDSTVEDEQTDEEPRRSDKQIKEIGSQYFSDSDSEYSGDMNT
jgi:hypothetical protein